MLPSLVLALALQAPGGALGPDSALERGVALVEKGDAAAAVAELDEAVRRLAAERRFADLARAHLHLGAAYALLGQERAARASFKEALRWSEVRFGKGRMPPQVIALFAGVLQEARPGGAPAEVEVGAWYEVPSSGCCLEVGLPPGTRQVVVDARGGGDFRSIAAAIRSGPSVRILLRPGTYRESLVLDRPVVLIGEGAREAIVVEGEGAPALTVRTAFALVEGVVLRARPAGSAAPFAVDVAQGQLLLRGCDLSSETRSVVAVHEAATAQVEDCLVHGAREAGVLAFAGGTATVKGGRIQAGASGVVAIEKARVTLEGVEISNHTLAGVALASGGRAIVKGGRVVRSEQIGILIDEGDLLLEDGLIEDNRMGGLVVRRGGAATARRCEFRKNRGYGVLVLGGGSATIEDSTFTGNRAGGLRAEAGGVLTRRGNRD
jgi:hypothetical protein